MFKLTRQFRIARAVAWFVASVAPLETFAQTTRDSAGVQIVENAKPAFPATSLRLSATPMLSIGTDSGSAYQFGRVQSVARLADGSLLVSNGATQELRVFDRNGRHVRSFGGKGTEPGQFTQMSGARVIRGDTIVVGDGMRTMSDFAADGRFLRRSTYPSAAEAPGQRPNFQILLATLRDGSRLYASFPRQAARDAGTRWADSTPMRLVSRGDTVIKELGPLAYVELTTDGKQTSAPWLGATGAFAGGAANFYTGYGNRYAIQVYGARGNMVRIIRRAWTPVAVTPADWERWVIEWSKLWVEGTGDAREKKVQEVRDSEYAETLPAFSEMIEDAAGRLWVRDAQLEASIGAGSFLDVSEVPSQWSVFDAKGRWLTQVTMPAQFRAYDIGTDYVAGSLRQPGKRPLAVVYRLETTVRALR